MNRVPFYRQFQSKYKIVYPLSTSTSLHPRWWSLRVVQQFVCLGGDTSALVRHRRAHESESVILMHGPAHCPRQRLVIRYLAHAESVCLWAKWMSKYFIKYFHWLFFMTNWKENTKTMQIKYFSFLIHQQIRKLTVLFSCTSISLSFYD